MSDLTLMISAIEECSDCCSKNAGVSAEVILAEVFVFVDCCCVLIVNVLLVVLYESGMLES